VGNAGGQAVLNLADGNARVTMLVRGDRLAKTMSAYLVDRIEAYPLIDVRLQTEARALHADCGALAGIEIAGP
jgi:thioredoxin reductase (NADPH)